VQKDDYLRIARDTGVIPTLVLSEGGFYHRIIIAFASAEECARKVDDSMFEFTLKAGITNADLIEAIRSKDTK
jgi:hypothetical protein